MASEVQDEKKNTIVEFDFKNKKRLGDTTKTPEATLEKRAEPDIPERATYESKDSGRNPTEPKGYLAPQEAKIEGYSKELSDKVSLSQERLTQLSENARHQYREEESILRPLFKDYEFHDDLRNLDPAKVESHLEMFARDYFFNVREENFFKSMWAVLKESPDSFKVKSGEGYVNYLLSKGIIIIGERSYTRYLEILEEIKERNKGARNVADIVSTTLKARKFLASKGFSEKPEY